MVTISEYHELGAHDWTVLLMLPGYLRDNECCEADWIVRINAKTKTAEGAEMSALWQVATDRKISYEQAAQEYATVAIFRGKLFDHHQP